jgi:glutamine synthetase
MTGDILEGMRLTGWDTGYGDMFARPDLSTFHWLPWRRGVGLVMSDLTDHHGDPIRTAPRTVLRRAIDRLAGLGYKAELGVELEFYLLRAVGGHLADGIQCYSLQKANEMEPVVGAIFEGLASFCEVEGANVEYGPAQYEVNLRHAPPLEAADQASRFKYGTKELARRNGAVATFMAKPFNVISGCSMHLHLSLWKDGDPGFAPDGEGENALHRKAVGGVMRHLPGIVLLGSPTVNSYKRFENMSFAPTTASWGGDNRTVAVRSLVESPSATRIELRTGAADAEPHWAAAGFIAAVIAGLEGDIDPGVRGEGNLYGKGEPLPRTLFDAVQAARADETIMGILGEDAVMDYSTIALAEWERFCLEVTDWDRERYLRMV